MGILNLATFEVTMEKNGRLKLPSLLLKQFPEEERQAFYITHGLNHNIILWTESALTERIEKVNQLDGENVLVQNYKKVAFRRIVPVETDSQNRIIIPKLFIEKYQFQKDLVLWLENGKVEIWDAQLFDSKFDMSPEEVGLMNQEVFTNHLKQI